MSLKALITLLVLGSSSVALADTQLAPPPPPQAQSRFYTPDTPDMRDHGDVMRGRWGRRSVMLASNVQLTSGFRDHRGQRPLFIDVNDRMGGISKLRFDRAEGFTHIDSVIVMLPNGTWRTYRVDQSLSYRSPSVTIDLDSRMITGLYVYGSSGRGMGTFNVTGIRDFGGYRRY